MNARSILIQPRRERREISGICSNGSRCFKIHVKLLRTGKFGKGGGRVKEGHQDRGRERGGHVMTAETKLRRNFHISPRVFFCFRPRREGLLALRRRASRLPVKRPKMALAE